MEGELFTWDNLKTISGSALFVFLFVQYTKDFVLKFLKIIPTDIYTVAVSFLVLFTTQAASGGDLTDWKLYVLAFFNAFIVASTSSHIYAKTKNPPKVRSKEDGETPEVER